MAFDIFRFIAGRAIIENTGVSADQSAQLALVPAFLEMPLPMSLITARAIGEREAPVPTARPVTPQKPPDLLIHLRNVISMHVDEAIALLEHLGLVVKILKVDSDKEVGTVIAQDPEAGAVVAPGTAITLYVAVSGPDRQPTPGSAKGKKGAAAASEELQEAS